MENKKERIRLILSKNSWSHEDHVFVMNCIERGDFEAIQKVSKELFDKEIENPQELLSKGESDLLLKKIDMKIGGPGIQGNRYSTKWMAIAASFLVLIVAGILTQDYWISYIFPNNTVRMTTRHGEIKEIQLPDGSEIWLNGGSVLEYPNTFEGDQRPVVLEGEAFFKVQPDESKPFVIRSGAFETTVVGTEFNVMAYKEDTLAAVAVVSGVVRVGLIGDSEDGFTINPDEEVVFNKNNRLLALSEGDRHSQLNWRAGEFKYTGIPLGEVLKDFQRAFDVNIQPGENIKNCKIYADFRGDPLKDMLEVLKSLVNANITEEKNGQYKMTGLDEGC